MATIAIGDVHGSAPALYDLLDQVWDEVGDVRWGRGRDLWPLEQR
jgi:hypothetical protein